MDFNKIELSILNKSKDEILWALQKHPIKYIHVDIMDWYFTNSLSSISPFFLKNLDLWTYKLHLHFMVNDIEKFFPYFSIFENIENISYHFESEIIKKWEYTSFNKHLQSNGIKIWLVLNPETYLTSPEILRSFDFIQLMTVNPGKWGQSFIPEMWKKIQEYKQKYPNTNLYIDWWVNETIYKSYDDFVDRFIMWSFLY